MFKFDKSQYKARRDRGIRGQENNDNAAPSLAKWTKEDHEEGRCPEDMIGKERTSSVSMHMVKGGVLAVTRRMKRQKERGRVYFDRTIKVGKRTNLKPDETPVNGMVEREDKTGKLLTRKGAIHKPNPTKNKPVQLPIHDPKTTNRERNVARKNERERVGGIRG